MKRIEFIGASGVGKTTLFQKVLMERSKKDKWLTPEELRIKLAAKQNNYFPNINNLAVLLLRSKILSKKHNNRIASFLLRKFKKDALYGAIYPYNGLLDLVIKKKLNQTKKLLGRQH